MTERHFFAPELLVKCIQDVTALSKKSTNQKTILTRGVKIRSGVATLFHRTGGWLFFMKSRWPVNFGFCKRVLAKENLLNADQNGFLKRRSKV
jgi:hypothetical protein